MVHGCQTFVCCNLSKHIAYFNTLGLGFAEDKSFRNIVRMSMLSLILKAIPPKSRYIHYEN